MIPYYSFEQFVHKVEEVGASNRVRINFFLPLRVCFHSMGQQDLSPTMKDGPSQISYQHHTAPARYVVLPVFQRAWTTVWTKEMPSLTVIVVGALLAFSIPCTAETLVYPRS